MTDILVVGQTPPPYHGQSIMIEEMLKGSYKDIRLRHVRMHFSKETGEVGRFQLGKLFHLFFVVMKIYFYRFRFKTKVLYYPPAGPDKIPFLRDMVILFFTRFLFKKVVFHFHAAGVSTLYDSLPGILKFFFRRCYFYPDAGVRLSPYNPGDPEFMKAKKEWLVPNGVADYYAAAQPADKEEPAVVPSDGRSCRVLFVGALQETKGVAVLVEACRILENRGVDFKLHLVGGWESREFQERVMAKIKEYKLENRIILEGVLAAEKKFHQYRQADIFCYPTFYECETFGIVLLEAMQFSLPITATRWRGVQSVVRDGETGFLVPPQDSAALADKLQVLIEDPALRRKMQENGRRVYLREYTIEQFHSNMEAVFLSLVPGAKTT